MTNIDRCYNNADSFCIAFDNILKYKIKENII